MGNEKKVIDLKQLEEKKVAKFLSKWFEERIPYREITSYGFVNGKHIVRYFDQNEFDQIEFSKFEVKDTHDFFMGYSHKYGNLEEDLRTQWRKFMYKEFGKKYIEELTEFFEHKKQQKLTKKTIEVTQYNTKLDRELEAVL